MAITDLFEDSSSNRHDGVYLAYYSAEKAKEKAARFGLLATKYPLPRARLEAAQALSGAGEGSRGSTASCCLQRVEGRTAW